MLHSLWRSRPLEAILADFLRDQQSKSFAPKPVTTEPLTGNLNKLSYHVREPKEMPTLHCSFGDEEPQTIS